ncbi:ATP-binding protein [Thioalkalicoccus limnaeus]|uniref:histidine kinase n=1 Tax=Thioalkalicoccus limnaeus TaxID=120681 RepID=A0ABV4BBF7_9GAMM
MGSLRNRILVAASAVLILFLILTSLALERAFRDTAQAAREERLLGQIYLLMAAAEFDDEVLEFSDLSTEPRLQRPGSGLYAAVLGPDGQLLWESASVIGESLDWSNLSLGPGEQRAHRHRNDSDNGYLMKSFGVVWAIGPVPQSLTFAVAEDLAAFNAELTRFRTSLATWLGTMALLLLAALVIVMRWGLDPLRRVAAEISAIEAGNQSRLQGPYPSELQRLTDNLNALLAHERAQQLRLDRALADLAHSLKTPLAVLNATLSDSDTAPQTAAIWRAQFQQIERLIDYQLQRARSGAGAAAGLAAPIAVHQVIERLARVLVKVHRDKSVRVAIECDQRLVFRGPEGDLMEVVGNLLDNAFKWCRAAIRVRVIDERGLRIRIEDDGPGIPAAQRVRLLERGVRADELMPGHGIGLAVAREICTAYGGEVRIASSPLGGALFEARFAR